MKDNSDIENGHCASEWGGRVTGRFLFTDDEVRALIAAERDEICEIIRVLRIAKECVQDDIDRMHNRTISDVLTIIRSRQEPQG